MAWTKQICRKCRHSKIAKQTAFVFKKLKFSPTGVSEAKPKFHAMQWSSIHRKLDSETMSEHASTMSQQQTNSTPTAQHQTPQAFIKSKRARTFLLVLVHGIDELLHVVEVGLGVGLLEEAEDGLALGLILNRLDSLRFAARTWQEHAHAAGKRECALHTEKREYYCNMLKRHKKCIFCA